MSKADSLVIIYLCTISVVTVVFTVYDKLAAKLDMWRIPENYLMSLGFFGGALTEYIVMRLIRHKTQHKKFMLGLPFMIILHLVVLIVYLFLTDSH